MRKIKFKEPTSEEWKNWRTKCKTETKKIVDEWKPNVKIKIKDTLYKKFKTKLYFHPDGPFYGKCAYCETSLKYHEDLDHYRPKLRVDNRYDKPIRIVVQGNEIDHPGYYWLAYSWDNLFPACKDCNSPSIRNKLSIGKRNRFPIYGKYAQEPGEEKNEKPLIINPTKDFPERHFNWDQKHKMIIANSNSKKAKITIELLGFYEREQLMMDWKKAFKFVITEFTSLVTKSANDDPDFHGKLKEFVLNIKLGKVPHSFVAIQSLKHLQLID